MTCPGTGNRRGWYPFKDLELVSGHPMLTQNAIQAVRQWRYRPFLLNGEPVEVETSVAIMFQISQ